MNAPIRPPATATEDAAFGLPPRKTLTLDGARMSYIDAGHGEPVVLMHGYPQSLLIWRHIIPELTARYRVIAPDWLGWGESEQSFDIAYDYDTEVARIGRFLDALGLAQVNLVTHDYGGFLGLGFVIGYGHRVKRFATMNSRSHSTFPAETYRLFARLTFLAQTPGLKALFPLLPLATLNESLLSRYFANGSFSRELLRERYIPWLRTWRGKKWFGYFFENYELPVRPHLAEGLGGIACPTAIVWGDKDPYCPWPIAEELAAGIPNATLTRAEGADHYLPEERPETVLQVILDLLDRPA